MVDTSLIALDWGTTSLRAYRFDAAGHVAESRHLSCGIMQCVIGDNPRAGFERALAEACDDWIASGPAPLVACGMIGSKQGWREAPYLDVPADLSDLGRALVPVETERGVLHIIPGLIARGALPDVMRGEETQIAGVLALAADALRRATDTRGDVWIGLPGTHAKWARVSGHRVMGFRTFMTGELFAALCEHTILGRTMQPAAAPDLDAFDRGVDVARSPCGRAGVLSTMFSARTLGLVGALAPRAQADYLSGLLIGHEIAALEALGITADAAIVLAGGDALCQRYQRALAASGRAAAIASAATERGLWCVAAAAGLMADAAR